MKAYANGFGPVFLSLLTVFTVLLGCSEDSPTHPQMDSVATEEIDDSVNDDAVNLVSEADKEALLFMLEEEKLARDTYKFLYEYWELVQFENIMQSEQSHMNAVETLLKTYNIEYDILGDGVFENVDLQGWYDKFMEDGIVDEVAGLTVGATIEDLDIVDLEEHIQATSKTDIMEVFSSLQCGSRNHLRSFVQSIKNLGETYTPQFLTQEEYNTILEGSHEQCN